MTATMTSREFFKHAQLDQTQGSIRLLKILPTLSPDGLIECEIRDDSTDATYTCLSYVWGSEYGQQDILVNGKLFLCRRNLWDFISVARIKYAASDESFWIDAVCIDQNNDSEKGLQVAQMGHTYSCAAEVLIWLGCGGDTPLFLAFVARLVVDIPPKDLTAKSARKYWYTMHSTKSRAGWLSFWANTYWTRAWITQEVLLAKSLRMLADDIDIGTRELQALSLLFPVLEKAMATSSGVAGEQHQAVAPMMEMYVRAIAGDKSLHVDATSNTVVQRSMVDLSYTLRNRGCLYPRDRIYSLRAIADDGNRVTVDYGASDTKCLAEIVKALHRSMCFCSLANIAQVLGYASIDTSKTSQQFPELSLSMQITGLGRRDLRNGPGEWKQPFEWSKTQVHRLDAKSGCSMCQFPVAVDLDKEYLICLGEQCRKRLGTHLVVRKSPCTLRVVTSKDVEFDFGPVSLHIDKSKSRPKERPTQLTQIGIDMTLDRWIDLTVCADAGDGSMCSFAGGKSPETGSLSTASQQMKIHHVR